MLSLTLLGTRVQFPPPPLNSTLANDRKCAISLALRRSGGVKFSLPNGFGCYFSVSVGAMACLLGCWIPYNGSKASYLHAPFGGESMPRKKDTSEWKTDARGRYRRMIGWKIENGKRVQRPFYLGTDLDHAKARYLRVRELWAHLERTHKESLTFGLNSKFDPPEDEPEYLWDSQSLWVARELAAGRVQNFVPEEPEVYEAGKASWQLVIEDQQKWLPLPLANAAPQSSALLHEAIDRYVEHIQKTDLEPTPEGPQLTAFGYVKVEQARRIKSRQPDQPLSTLDLQGCQELLDYWRMRPLTEPRFEKPSKPMERRYCENHIAELNWFFRWLHKSKDFAWRKPEDFDELETRVKDLPDERTSIEFLNVEVYSLDELAILNKYATPLERLLLLLGLNCGFKGAEQGTLRFEHLFLDKPHPHAAMIREKTGFDIRPEDRFVLYSRNKSKVYGEFLLWPQTLEGLRWAAARHRRICDRKKVESSQLLLTDQGIPFFRRTQSTKNRSQIFVNKWAGLMKRIRKDHPDFPRYSFTTLRDTAADRIRHIAGGEVAAVFLMHGKPVKKDDLLDLYTNRPFGEVFKALRQLEQDLQPIFDAAPDDAWVTPMQQYTSLSTREQMLELHRQGVKAPEIARRFGKSPMTVYRLIERLQDHETAGDHQ